MKIFLKENLKYFIAAAVLLVVIVYSGFVPRVEKISENKNSFKEKVVVEADLDKDNQVRVYKNILNSKSGDFYRLTFKANSLEDEEISVFIISETGKKKELGRVKISKENKDKNFELIFNTEDSFRDVVFERIIDTEAKNENVNNWENNEIYLSQVNVSRLNIENQDEVSNLEKTIFGDESKETVYLLSRQRNFDLSKKNKKFCKSFDSSGGLLSSVVINFDQVGDGGGVYKLEIRDQVGESNIDGKLIEKVNFTPKDLADKLQKDYNNYKFNLPLKLKEDKKYFFCINNEKASTDISNYLKVNALEGKDIPKDSIMGLEINKPFISHNKELSNNARIEDLGKYLVYSYKNSRKEMDVLDVYEQKGDTKFDEKNELIVNKMKKGNYTTYKVDTIYPFHELRLELNKLKDKKRRDELSYSFDNSNWHKIENGVDRRIEGVDGKKREIQIYDVIIDNNEENNTEFYVRIKCVKSSSSNEKVFGLNDLEITAKLKKQIE